MISDLDHTFAHPMQRGSQANRHDSAPEVTNPGHIINPIVTCGSECKSLGTKKNTSVGHLWHSHACPSHLLVPVLLQYPHQRAASSSCKHAADVIGRYALTRHLKQQQQGFLPESALGTRTNGTAIADHVRSHLDKSSSRHVFGKWSGFNPTGSNKKPLHTG